MAQEKIFVSACLLGEACRYDGQSKEDKALQEWLKDKIVIPICPEAPSLGTPREAISLIQEKDKYTLVGTISKNDVTTNIQNEVEHILQEHQDVKKAILKSKSPSCGTLSTPLYDNRGNFIGLDSGLASQMMQNKGVFIKDEFSYRDFDN